MHQFRIIRFNFEDKETAEMAFSVRRKVFVEEQQVDPGLEYEHEEEATHYLVLVSEIPVATARWRKTDEGIKLERFATLKEYRNKGIGSKLLQRMLEDVIPLQLKIYLNSQLPAIRFYERHGLKKVGEKFYEADMEHFKMVY